MYFNQGMQPQHIKTQFLIRIESCLALISVNISFDGWRR